MKMKFNFFLLTFLMLLLFACSDNKSSFVQQNNIIVSDQAEFYRMNDELFALFESDATKEKCVLMFDSMLVFLNLALNKYDTMSAVDGDKSLIDAMTEFLETYQQLAYQEYRDLLNIIIKPRYLFENKDVIAIDSLYGVIEFRQQEIDSIFAAKQKAFSNRHGMTLVQQ
jgi:hypothetical protein